ncbi:unnamed protein product, partial [Effrenium voratum]
RLGVWMSPFGGYGAAGGRRVRFGAARGYERSHRGGFALAGPKYFQAFRSVVRTRIAEGFRLFKFDGLGGGLGQSGGEADRDDFEAMLSLIQELRPEQEDLWISLTIGTWPSPFWLLWADSIWRDGPDVGSELGGSARDRWLSFRDNALRRAHLRGPLFPVTAFMQHGVVWSKSAETADMWDSGASLEDFCNEALSFFLAGTGLQGLYIQSELMTPSYWKALAKISSFARQEAALLRDAHLLDLGAVYGAAALDASEHRALFWLRNPSGEVQSAQLSVGEALELPDRLLERRWHLAPLELASGCPSAATVRQEVTSSERLSLTLRPFEVHAYVVS